MECIVQLMELAPDEKRVLERDSVVFGLPCAAGTEVDEFDRSGTLSRDFELRGVVLPKGSKFSHDCDFDFFSVRLSEETCVYGLHAPRASLLEFDPRFPRFPMPSSAIEWLRACALLPVIPVATLPYVLRPRKAVVVTPCQDVLCRGWLKAKEGDRIKVRRSGRIVSLLLSSPRSVKGVAFATGNLFFDSNERLTAALLYRDQEIGGFPCLGTGMAGTEARFYGTGGLRQLVLSREHEVHGTRYERGTKLRFDGTGAVTSAKKLDVETPLYTSRPELHNLGAQLDRDDRPDE